MAQRTNPYEVYAKYILEAMYGERYGILLLRDTSDLQTADGESGIKVMSVNSEAFHYIYIDSAGRLACFDLAHGAFELVKCRTGCCQTPGNLLKVDSYDKTGGAARHLRSALFQIVCVQIQNTACRGTDFCPSSMPKFFPNSLMV